MKIYLLLFLNLYLIGSISLSQKKEQYNLKGSSLSLDKSEDNLNQKDSNLKLADGEFNSSEIMELESDFIITQIRWNKNDNDDLNYLLGIFEGANDPSFKDAVPLAMIKGELQIVNYIEVNTSNTYRYVRYIPPNKEKADISPIKLSGELKSEVNASQKKDFQVTNLPLVSIHVDNSVFPSNKEQEYNCKVVIINNGKIETNEKATIKIRGKSTSGVSDKKPYRLKFETKQQILGLAGSYKKWTLIANFYDKSLIRNAVAFKVSEIMKFDFTARYIPVDVIMNGDYRGTYYLCDQMDVGEERINIEARLGYLKTYMKIANDENMLFDVVKTIKTNIK